MAIRRYRTGWANLLALASTLLLSLMAASEVNAEGRVNGLSASDLIGGELNLRSTPAQAVQSSVEITQNMPAPSSDTFSPLTDEEIRQQLLLEPATRFSRRTPRPVPASSFLTPNAYGADWGDAYISLAQVTGGRPANSNFDGSLALGFGFGDAVKNIGVETSVSIISLNPDDFAYDGIVGFKLHKLFPKAGLAVAAGWSNPIKWGEARQRDDNFYGVVTKQFDLRPRSDNSMPLTASLGLETGNFRSVSLAESDDNPLKVFGSVSVSVIPELSLITSWTGNSLGVAASTAPFNFPLVLTVGGSDLTDNTDEGPRFSSTLGYSFSF